MKPIILKRKMPIAVCVLGILGAFATTSMQSTAKEDTLVYGYAPIPGNPCGLQVDCSDEIGTACHVDDNSAKPQAFGMDSETTCAQQLSRPD